MKQYMLSVIHENGYPSPTDESMDQIGRDVDTLNEEIRAAGAWVFGAGLYPQETASVVRVQDGDVMTTDGPYAESKEQVGGFWILKARDLDQALEWAVKATRACQVPIEVRPVQDEVEA